MACSLLPGLDSHVLSPHICLDRIRLGLRIFLLRTPMGHSRHILFLILRDLTTSQCSCPFIPSPDLLVKILDGVFTPLELPHELCPRTQHGIHCYSMHLQSSRLQLGLKASAHGPLTHQFILHAIQLADNLGIFLDEAGMVGGEFPILKL